MVSSTGSDIKTQPAARRLRMQQKKRPAPARGKPHNKQQYETIISELCLQQLHLLHQRLLVTVDLGEDPVDLLG